ncbi:sugar ABC transporter substrate-binding protein [Paenibacillus sp. WQ 127069]|uniref:Sugar ABC transporter substrate-binding protein n=1 Tax=Paenibacillus baimaensis TaxID=2982185 RepID=A0ABT2UT84_9BACL|nr:sugar ABC transporter substrate-binding protein [Paenibacillus sp. WQ 127069]MCU6797868.1 sugar ABC transporter substrate-binding protein [Paenibacillus sp. WQ 127069]
MNQKMKKWLPASVATIMAMSIIAGCGNGTPAPVPAADSGKTAAAKPFEGKKLTVVTANHPWGEAIKPLLPEFEAQTGMKVEVQSFFEDQLTQKLTVQFTSGSATPDVFMYRPLQEGKLFYKNGWVQALDEYVKKDASYDFEDFTKSSIGSTTVDGKLAGIPIITEQEILYYRKDLLQKANIAVPKTLDELTAAVKKLHDPKSEMYGFVARGQRSPLVTQVSSFLYSEGGDFTKDDKATLNTPEAIKAFTTYSTLLKDYAPPGVLNMSWPQALGIFAQGKVAFITDANSLYKNTTDPEKSVIADKVGYALFPGGQAGSKPYNITSWGLAMNSKTANKDASWEFVKWATGKDVVLKTQKLGNPGPRASVWDKPDGVSGFPAEMVQVIKDSSKGGVDHDRPVVIGVGEARDVVGSIVLQGMTGGDIKAAADKANQELQVIIDKEKGK